jgi:ubiquinone biosynthesis protein
MSRIVAGLKLARAAFVLAREGVIRAAAPPDPPPLARLVLGLCRLIERRDATKKARGLKVSDALHRLGPSYVKLGQFLATRPDIIGADLADDLGRLQDQVAAVPLAEIRHQIEADLGAPLETVFLDLSEAVAAASVAQVHKGRIRDRAGEVRDVAVKVLRPDVEGRFRRDLTGFYLAARLIERLVPASRRLRPVEVVDVLARTMRMELDLRLEAAAISEMAENTRDDAGFRLPGIQWDLTRRTVLVIEWIDGVKVSDRAGLVAAGHDLPALAATIVQSFLRHAMRDGFFHADMHQGNLFVDRDGRVVAVDLGIVGRLSRDDRRFLAEILHGFISRDYRKVSRVHFEAGLVPASESVEDFAQAVRAIGEPIRDRVAADISMGHLLGQLIDYTGVFNMKTQPRLVLLQKTMVVVEGVARGLDPRLDIWTVAEPVVGDWIRHNLGVATRLEEAGASLGALTEAGRAIPRLVDRLERGSAGFARMAEEGLRLDPLTVARLAEAGARRDRTGRWALVAIAAAAIVAALALVS